MINNLSSDVTLEGLDSSKNEVWNYSEIDSLLKTIKIFAEVDIFSENPLNNLKNMEETKVQDLAESISNSIFITKNLNNLLEQFDDELGITLEKLATEDWTKNEVYSVFKTITIIATMVDGDTVNIEDFLNLKEKDLDIILESKLLRGSLKQLLIEKSKEGGELELLKGVYEEDYYVWDDIVENSTISLNNQVLEITKVNGARKYIIYRNGMYFTSTVDCQVNLNSIEGYQINAQDEFKVVAIKTYGELRCVFNAITCLEINDVENFEVDLRNVISKKDTLFESYILVETLIDQIRQLSKENPDGVLIIPDEFKENGTGNWRDFDGQVGELNNIINALDIALGISSSTKPVMINSIDLDNISLKNIVDNYDEILKSQIISYTIVDLFQESASDSEIVLPSEYSTNDYSLWLDNDQGKGELSIIFDVIEKAVDLPETGFEIDVETISLNNIITHKDEILKSAVLTATIVDMISDLGNDSSTSSSILTIPNEFKINESNSWERDYNKWKNYYNVDGTVQTYGELSKLINSLDLALGITEDDVKIDITNIKEDDISLKRIVNKKEEVFESDILVATVVEMIKDINTETEPNNIIIPVEYQDGYELWRGDNGELCIILEVLDDIGLIPETGIEVDIENITISSIINNKDELIKSAILTATIVDKIIEMDDVLTIPNEYDISSKNPSWNTDYDNWKGQGKELYNIICGLQYALVDLNIKVENLSLENISLKSIINNKEEVFVSDILTATVVFEIQKLEGTVKIPSEYKGNYKEWQGENKELDLLLNGLSNVVEVPDTGFQISTDNIKLNNIIKNSDEILKSAILTATITDKILSLDSTLIIPDKYKINSTFSWETDYELWKNKYNENMSVSSYGELSYILGSVDNILGISSSSTDVTIDSLSSSLNDFSINSLVLNRSEILKSYIISATIIDKVVNLDGNGIVIPNDYKITASNYDKWMNVYNNGSVSEEGELSRLLVSVNTLLGQSAASTKISDINIGDSINGMIKEINNDTSNDYRKHLLGSIIVSETIVSKISEFESIKDYIKTAETIQKGYNNNISLLDSNNRSDWYLIDENGTVHEKELWNILTSVSLLLGSSETDFSSVDDFTIDDLISSSMNIEYDKEYEVLISDVEILLKSYIIEHIFAKLTEQLLGNTFNNLINSGTFNYYKNDPKVKLGDEYDLRTFLESFYIMNRYIDYSTITSSFTKLGVIANNENGELDDLAAGMVISRTFRNSIATMYNSIFAGYYGSIVIKNQSLLQSHPLPGMTKFDQTRYDISDTLTKVNAHDNFVNDYKAIYAEYHALEG